MFLHWTPLTNTSRRAYEVISFSSQSAAEVLTTQSKFGTYSMNARGGGYVQYYSVPDFAIGTQDFAIEFWYWLVETNPYDIAVISQAGSLQQQSGSIYMTSYFVPQTVSWQIRQTSTGNLELLGPATRTIASSVTTGSWHHVAVSRTSGTLETYLDGTRTTTGANTTDITVNHIWLTGFPRVAPNDSDPGYYMDGVRLTIGSNAGYSGSTITPPTTMPGYSSGQTRLRLNFEGSFDDID